MPNAINNNNVWTFNINDDTGVIDTTSCPVGTAFSGFSNASVSASSGREELERLYNDIMENNLNEMTVPKKKKLTQLERLKKEIIKTSLSNKNYFNDKSRKQNDCYEYYKTMFKNMNGFTEKDLKVFCEQFRINFNGYGLSSKAEKIENMLDSLLQNNFSNLKTVLCDIRMNNEDLQKRYERFCNILVGYINKTEKYDRNSKSIRNFISINNF